MQNSTMSVRTIADLEAAYPHLVAAIRKEAVVAHERQRLSALAHFAGAEGEALMEAAAERAQKARALRQ